MSRGIKQITSEAIVIFKDNIDTDILIPKNYLKTTKELVLKKLYLLLGVMIHKASQ